jgi:hypothetical protein
MDPHSLEIALASLEGRTVGRMKMAHILEMSDGSLSLLDFGLVLPPGSDPVESVKTCCSELGRHGLPIASAPEMWARYVKAPILRALDFPCPCTLKGIMLLAIRRES